jgi:hypothetical protein
MTHTRASLTIARKIARRSYHLSTTSSMLEDPAKSAHP